MPQTESQPKPIITRAEAFRRLTAYEDAHDRFLRAREAYEVAKDALDEVIDRAYPLTKEA